MATITQQQKDRDARLDRLKQATIDWAKKEEQRLTDEATFLESILQGRTGAGRLAQQNVVDTYNLTVDAIDRFLIGD
jgi:hypothetical protein